MVTCPTCNKEFANNNSLRTHRSRLHGPNMEDNTQTFKDTPIPDDSDLDSDGTNASIADTEESDRDKTDIEDTDGSEITESDTDKSSGYTSEYENSDSSVSPVKRKVYRKRRRDALSSPVDSSEEDYPKKKVRRSFSLVDRHRSKHDLFSSSSDANKITKIHSILKDNFKKGLVDYGIIELFLHGALPKIQSHLLYEDTEEMYEKAGPASQDLVAFAKMPIETLTRYKMLHDIFKDKVYEKSAYKIVKDYVLKYE